MSRRSKGRAPRDRLPQAGSGSTRHDRRRASRLAAPLPLASSRTPEQERDVLPTSAQALQPPSPSPSPSSAPDKKPVVSAPDDETDRLPPPPPNRRSDRDPQIPIGRARSNSALPPRGFLLTRLSNAGPRVSHDRPKGPASETLQYCGRRGSPSRRRRLGRKAGLASRRTIRPKEMSASRGAAAVAEFWALLPGDRRLGLLGCFVMGRTRPARKVKPHPSSLWPSSNHCTHPSSIAFVPCPLRQKPTVLSAQSYLSSEELPQPAARPLRHRGANLSARRRVRHLPGGERHAEAPGA